MEIVIDFYIYIALEVNRCVTNNDECLWLIYDTTNMEKLDFHIVYDSSPTDKSLKEISQWGF